MINNILRFDILLMRLNPTAGSEIRKTRPCVVLSLNKISSLKNTHCSPNDQLLFGQTYETFLNFQGFLVSVKLL